MKSDMKQLSPKAQQAVHAARGYLADNNHTAAHTVLSKLLYKDLEGAAEAMDFTGIYNTKTKKELLRRMEAQVPYLTARAREEQRSEDAAYMAKRGMDHLIAAHLREKELRELYDNPPANEVDYAERRVRVHGAGSFAWDMYQKLLRWNYKPTEAADGVVEMRGHLSDDWGGLKVEEEAAQAKAELVRHGNLKRLREGRECVRGMVIEAVAEGKPVPRVILDDYIDVPAPKAIHEMKREDFVMDLPNENYLRYTNGWYALGVNTRVRELARLIDDHDCDRPNLYHHNHPEWKRKHDGLKAKVMDQITAMGLPDEYYPMALVFPVREQQHRREVVKALAAGKIIPAGVMADYPDLIAR